VYMELHRPFTNTTPHSRLSLSNTSTIDLNVFDAQSLLDVTNVRRKHILMCHTLS